MELSAIHVPLDTWTAEDVQAAVKAAPPALCGEAAEANTLASIKPCDTFAELLYQLYPTHTGNLAAAGRLAERVAKSSDVTTKAGTLSLDQSVYPPKGHIGVVGNLTVQGDLDVVAALVVTGNLTVEGTLRDCGPQSRVVVLGDLECDHVWSSGWITVVGDVRIRGVLFGTYNDDAFEAHGSISAGAIVADEHAFEAKGGLAPRNQPADAGVWGPGIYDLRDRGHAEALKQLLGSGTIDDQDELVWERIPRAF
ncbi:hypothetical protein [Haliangium sp.]|uniref:hypothetical protein n=1 Tax=Haliangium sp. TaxID=2663208 RepID=UPI003D0C01C0